MTSYRRAALANDAFRSVTKLSTARVGTKSPTATASATSSCAQLSSPLTTPVPPTTSAASTEPHWRSTTSAPRTAEMREASDEDRAPVSVRASMSSRRAAPYSKARTSRTLHGVAHVLSDDALRGDGLLGRAPAHHPADRGDDQHDQDHEGSDRDGQNRALCGAKPSQRDGGHEHRRDRRRRRVREEHLDPVDVPRRTLAQLPTAGPSVAAGACGARRA